MSAQTNDTPRLYEQFVMPTYAPEITLVSGQGSYVTDKTGNSYLDFGTGIGVCSLGHCHPRVTGAIQQQAEELVHISNLFFNEKQAQLAKELSELTLGGKVFFCNSGAEANEGMFKLARKYGAEEQRHEIISLENSFHGRTLGTLGATGQEKHRQGFQPDVEGFVHVPINSMEALESALSERTIGVILEPIQGEGGVIPLSGEYLQQVRDFCDRNNLLLMFDEVQSGMGKTGSYFAYQYYDVKPDMLAMAKALGNGFPIGAFIARRTLADTLGAGSHASTFGGTPLACAASLAVLETFREEKVLQNCRTVSGSLCSGLKQLQRRYSQVQEIRGLGLMLGIALDRPAGPYLKEARNQGLIVLKAGDNILRLLPPLNVSEEELNEGLNILDKVFASG